MGRCFSSFLVLSRIEHEKGVVYQQVGNTERFLPHSISVSMLRKGQENIQFDDSTAVCFTIGEENSYLEETPISAAFTEDIALQGGIPERGRDAYGGVRLGTILPFVGAKVPDGYRVIEPTNTWPVAKCHWSQ